MLGFLDGILVFKSVEHHQVILSVQGVGYEITVPRQILSSLSLNQPIILWVHTVVREDALALFGFSTEVEKQFFRLLLSVTGLGPKTALAVIGEHGPENLACLILNKKIDQIATAPGVGKKTAERLVLELGTKLEKWQWLENLKDKFLSPSQLPAVVERTVREDLVSALTNLGFQVQHIKSTLDKLLGDQDASKAGFELILKRALNEMSGRRMGERI